MAVATVVTAHGNGRCEPGCLALPVAEQRCRADDERGARGGGVGLAMQVQSEQGDGLAQAHVVGETAAETELAHFGQPGEAPFLIVAQRGLQCGGLRGGGAGFGVADTSDELTECSHRRAVKRLPVPLHLTG